MRAKTPKNKKIKKQILKPRENKIDTEPKLISSKKIIDENGREDEILEVEIYCPVDKNEFLKNDCDKITASIGKKDPSTIKSAFKLSSLKKEISTNKQKSRDKDIKFVNENTAAKEKLKRKGSIKTQSKKNVTPKMVNKSIRKAISNKNANIKSALKDYKKIGQFNFTPTAKNLPKKSARDIPVSSKRVKSFEKAAFGEKKIIKPVPLTESDVIKNKKIDRESRKRNTKKRDFRVSFEKFYNKNVISGKIDSATLFQDSYNKIGTKQKFNGKLKMSDKRKDPIFMDVFLGLKSEILAASRQQFKFKTSKKIKRVEKLKTTVRLSKKSLMSKNKNDNINVLLQGKNKKGINVQSAALSFNPNDLLKQKNKESQKFSLGVSRNSKDVSNVSIGKNKKEVASITLFAKPVTKTELPNKKTFAVVNQEILVTKPNKKIKDGSDTNTSRKKNQFKPGQDVFYRGTLNFNEQNYSNLKCVVDRSKKTKSENLPNSAITAKINHQDETIDLNIQGIASNVLKIKPFKQKFKGKSLTDPMDLLDEKGNKIDYTIVPSNRNLSFQDFDIDDGEAYKYSLYCMMKNGETKIHYNCFIEKYESRSEIVNIENVSISASKVNNSKPTSLEGETDENVFVQGTFVAKKIETESDKILQTLFGDLFDLFQKDLESTIKDLQGLVYSVEVVRINKATGQSRTIDRVLVKENNTASFEDRINASDEVFYKFIPRVIPASDAVSRVNDKISLIGPKEVFKKINFGFASNRKKFLNKEDRVVSKVGNKFNGRKVFSKGRIQTPEDDFEKNGFDFFAESSTGDIFYSEVVIPFERNGSKNSYKILSSNIREIKHFKESIENIEDKKKIQQQLFDITVKTNDDFDVDFYMIFVKENNDVYLDGIMNSNDAIKPENTYRYLIEHKGSLGYIEYFIVAVFKSGLIDRPKKIGSHIIE